MISKEELTLFAVAKLDERFKEPDDFLRALEQRGYKLGYTGWIEQMMDHPDFKESMIKADRDRKYNLVTITIADLFGEGRIDIWREGLENFRGKFFDKAREIGLEQCPAWIGPWFRLYRHKMAWDSLFSIGMEPITIEENLSFVFEIDANPVGFDDKLMSGRIFDYRIGGGPGIFYVYGWNPSKWVFVRPES